MNIKRLSALVLTLLTVLAIQAARVDTLTIHSPLLHKPMKVTMVTPDAAADKTRKFPTVYLLNGYGGDYRSWLTIQPRLKELADLYGMILVAPDGMDSWYFDAPANPKMKMESFFTKELVPFIDANFQTIDNPSQRAITGLSMGGHGALWLAMRHPDIWKNCGSTSGGVNIVPFGQKWKIPHALGAKPSAKTLAAHSVSTVAKTIKPGQNNIIFDCGADDFFFKVNSDLHNQLLNQKVPHDYISRPGGHSLKYWANSILYQLLFFNENFVKAAAK